MSANGDFPRFRPHPLVMGGDMQTIAAVYLPQRGHVYGAKQHRLALDDGDQLVLHDDCPPSWHAGDRVALLMHGLAGCHQSGYMVRIASKLAARGVRVFRLDLRGCGAGFGLARWPYHSGRIEDAVAAIKFIEQLCPGSPVSLVGFSLSGNIALKLCGELGESACAGLSDCLAICPPIDLRACSARLGARRNRLYDRHFVRMLLGQLQEKHRRLADAPGAEYAHRPRTLFEFDDTFTAPICGFGNAENYYRTASSAPGLKNIRLPTRIIAAKDDPMIPSEVFRNTAASSSVDVRIAEGGGHLGFLARRGDDPDTRWIDWRVVDWINEVARLTPTRSASEREQTKSTI
jgi:predicted alpha/beta-fold hydrolase